MSGRTDSISILGAAEELSAVFAERAARFDIESVFPAENYDDLHAAGITAITVPTSYGGLGANWELYLEVMGALARGCASTALAFNMHCTIVRFLDRFADDEQKRRVFAAVTEEGALLASITSEPQSTLRGGRLQMKTRARRTADGWVVSGRKHFCSLSTGARWFYTWCVDDRAKGLDALRTLLVPADAAGVEVHDDWDTLAMRATASNSITFHDVSVPAANEVPGSAELFRSGLLDSFVPGYGAIYTAIAEAAYRFCVEFVRSTVFEPDDRPISEYPVVQRQVAEMATLIEASRGLVRRAGRIADDGALIRRRDRAVAFHQSKLFAAQTARSVTQTALEACGGRALSRRLPLERYLRDAQAGPVMGPALDTSRELIGQLELGVQPRLQRG
ncbi:MAG: acyl-CoA dehydrogenase family protein [Acidimicrobiales bacterium]